MVPPPIKKVKTRAAHSDCNNSFNSLQANLMYLEKRSQLLSIPEKVAVRWVHESELNLKAMF